MVERTIHALVATLSLLIVGTAQAGPYTGIYFFGDSLTDVGNVTATYATLPHPPGAPTTVPGAPYFNGRASNGPLYADALATGLGFSATPSVLGGNDYAFGGARTRYQLSGSPYLGIVDQVSAFRALPGPADPGALYVLFAGANNIQDILSGRTIDALGNPVPGIGGTLGDIVAMLAGLYAEGARNILVPNVPNIGRVPRVTDNGPAAVAGGTALSQAFDTGLGNLLDSFVVSHPDAHVFRFDTYGALEDIVANASAYGLTDLTHRCYTGDDLGFTGGGTVCANPENYLFWDGIHPTATVHAILAREMLAVLGVPEPDVIVLVTIGALCLALARQRSRNGLKFVPRS